MKKSVLLLIVACFTTLIAQAQCDQCTKQDGFNSEFCFTSKVISKACAQFTSTSENFYYSNQKGKTKALKLGESTDFGYLVSLAQDKKLKLKAVDILFIQKALQAWEKKAIDNMIEAGKDIALEKEGYKTMGSGLGIKVVKEGKGPQAEKGQKVEVHYRGMLEDGTEFDNSFKRGSPIGFPLGGGRVIKGWDEGIAMLKVGSAAWLKIPPTLGYGSRSAGPIPPNSTLYFYVVLVDAK